MDQGVSYVVLACLESLGGPSPRSEICSVPIICLPPFIDSTFSQTHSHFPPENAPFPTKKSCSFLQSLHCLTTLSQWQPEAQFTSQLPAIGPSGPLRRKQNKLHTYSLEEAVSEIESYTFLSFILRSWSSFLFLVSLLLFWLSHKCMFHNGDWRHCQRS